MIQYRLALLLLLLISTASWSAKGVLAGAGTSAKPYLIEDADDLAMVGNGAYSAGAHYRLVRDLQMNYKELPTLASGGVFSGYIHGGGHSIRKARTFYRYFIYELSVDAVIDSLGFDSLLYDYDAYFIKLNRGTIRQIKLTNIYNDYSYPPYFINTNYGELANVFATGSWQNGALVNINKGTIRNSYFAGSGSGSVNTYANGLVALPDSSTAGSIVGSYWDKDLFRGYPFFYNAPIDLIDASDYCDACAGNWSLQLDAWGSTVGNSDNGYGGYSVSQLESGSENYVAAINQFDPVKSSDGKEHFASLNLALADEGVYPGSCTDGFQYRYKGNAHRFAMHMSSLASDFHGKSMPASPGDWDTVTVTAADVQQINGSVSFDQKLVRSFSWTIVDNAGSLEIDDVMCLGGNIQIAPPKLVNSYKGTAKTSTEMGAHTLYDNWDFQKIWQWRNGFSYPRLRAFNDAPVATDDHLAMLDTNDYSALLANDFDPEGTASLVVVPSKVLGLQDDSLTFAYRVAEFTANGDTLWSNPATAKVPYKNGTPFYSIDISSLDQLRKIGNDWRYPLFAHYVLTQDIDASSTGKGTPFTSIPGTFSGSFDGENHVIRDLRVVGGGGLFESMREATLSNLVLSGMQVYSTNSSGCLARDGYNASITRLTVSCFNGTDGYSGGLFGSLWHGNVQKTVVHVQTKSRNTALVATAFSGYANNVNGYAVGPSGVMGENRGDLYPSFYWSKVAAGIELSSSSSQISSSSSSKISSSSSSKILSSSSSQISSSSSRPLAYGGIGLETNAMKLKATYVDWDFINDWSIDDGVSLPWIQGQVALPVALPDALASLDSTHLGALLTNDLVPTGSGTLVARLMGSSTMNSSKDSLWVDYQVGVVNASHDTLWGGFSWVAIPTTTISISNYAQLKSIGRNWCYPLNGHYLLQNHIKSDGTVFDPIGSETAPFQGEFDGNGKLLLNFTFSDTTNQPSGLFRVVGNVGYVHDFGLANVNVTKVNSYGAPIAGYNYGTISRVYTTGSLSLGSTDIDYVFFGAIVGRNMGLLEQSYSKMRMEARRFYTAPAQIAYTNTGTIRECYGASEGYSTRYSAKVELPGVSDQSGTMESSFWLDLDGNYIAGSGSLDDVGMRHAASFMNWDFSSSGNWEIIEGKTYPGLRALNDAPTASTVIINANGADFNKALLSGVTSGMDVDGGSLVLQPLNTAVKWSPQGDTLYSAIQVGEVLETQDTLWGTSATAKIRKTVLPLRTYADLALLNARDSSGNVAKGRFRLINDIDASLSASDGNSVFPIAAFNGVLYGDGHTIGNLVVKNEGDVGCDDIFRTVGYCVNGKGLFARIESDALIQNLRLVDTRITGSTGVAGLLAAVNYGKIEKIVASGSIESASEAAGGLVGANGGSIRQSYALVDLAGSATRAGGLVGLNSGSIAHVYASSWIAGGNVVGGLVGELINQGSIRNGFSSSAISGVTTGGIVGAKSSESSVMGCYFDSAMAGSQASQGGTPLAFSDFSSSSKFPEWNVDTTYWAFVSGAYPNLVDMTIPATAVADKAAEVPATADAWNALIANDWFAPLSSTQRSALFLQDGRANATQDSIYYLYRPKQMISASSMLNGHISYVAVPSHPIDIASYEDLLKIGTSWQYPQNGEYRLVADIDASASASKSWIPIGTNQKPFQGVFNGNYHTITGLVVNNLNSNYGGFFGTIGNKGIVENVGFVGISIQSDVGPIGSIALHNHGTIRKVFATGTIQASVVGALVGINEGSLSDCYASMLMEVSSDRGAGGLVYENSGIVDRCYTVSSRTGMADAKTPLSLIVEDMPQGEPTVHGFNLFALKPAQLRKDDFVGWDFSNTWSFDGDRYPSLKGFEWIDMAIPDQGISADALQSVSLLLKNDQAVSNHSLVGRRVNQSYMNKPAGDSLYAVYQVGWLRNGTDTLWLGVSWYSTAYGIVDISSYDDIQKIGRQWTHPMNAAYRQTQDIDASASQIAVAAGKRGLLPIGVDSTTSKIQGFSGIYDGGGFAIRNLSQQDTYWFLDGKVALFYRIDSTGIVRKLAMRNRSVNSGREVASIAAENYGAISNVSSDGSLRGRSAGGLVVRNYGSITKAYYSGNLSSTNDYGMAYGGSAGGIALNNSGTIADVYSTGLILGKGTLGGIVGENTGKISRCYTSFWTRGSVAGAIVGDQFGTDAKIENCYTDSSTGHSTVNGGVGLASDSMLYKKSFVGWDFQNIWEIREGVSFPGLQGINDAPVARADTSVDLLQLEQLLKNDADVENTPIFAKLTDYYEVRDKQVYYEYKVGEQISAGDTLWGGATWAHDAGAGYLVVRGGYKHRDSAWVDYKSPYIGDSVIVRFYISTDKTTLGTAIKAIEGPMDSLGSIKVDLSGYKNGSSYWVTAETSTPTRKRVDRTAFPVFVDLEAPRTISDLRAYSISAENTVLHWSAPNDNGGQVRSYIISANGSMCSISDVIIDTTNTSGTSEEFTYAFTSQQCGGMKTTQYEIRVYSVDSAGNRSAESNRLIVEPNNTSGDSDPPVFADFAPRTVDVLRDFSVSVKITDPSGVFVSESGNSTQDVYLDYSLNEALSNSTQVFLARTAGTDVFVSPSIGGLASGSTLYYRVYACDLANQPEGSIRTCGYSEIHQVTATKSDDDDVSGPTIAGMLQGSVSDALPIRLQATVMDASGVYDDATGSEGYGMYAQYRWGNSTVWTAVQMEVSATANRYTSVRDIPIEGTELHWRLFAYDNDTDADDPKDRSLSVSNEVSVVVSDDDIQPPQFVSVAPLTIPAGTPVGIVAVITDVSGIYSAADSIYVEYKTSPLGVLSRQSMAPTANDNEFASIVNLPALKSGQSYIYRIYACDNDLDRGLVDRACAYSDWHTVLEKPLDNDNDVVAPTITLLTEPRVWDSQPLYLRVRIDDASGIYDDSTGSMGQGVYARYRVGNGTWKEVMLSKEPDSTYRSDEAIVLPGGNQTVVYQVYAFDNDSDAGAIDRMQATSEVGLIQVMDDDTVIPVTTLSVPTSLPRGSVLPVDLSVRDVSGVLRDSLRLEISEDGIAWKAVAYTFSDSLGHAQIAVSTAWNQIHIRVYACDQDQDGSEWIDQSCGYGKEAFVAIDKTGFSAVVAQVNDKPLKGARVVISMPSGAQATALSDSNGRYTAQVNEGFPYQIQIAADGYMPVSETIDSNSGSNWITKLARVGNFDRDSADVVDEKDLILLAKQWKTRFLDSSWSGLYDIGPATGAIATLQIDPDSVIDYEDLVSFTRAWKYRKPISTLAKFAILPTSSSSVLVSRLMPVPSQRSSVRLLKFSWRVHSGDPKMQWRLPESFFAIEDGVCESNGECSSTFVNLGAQDYDKLDSSWILVTARAGESVELSWNVDVYDGDMAAVASLNGVATIADSPNMVETDPSFSVARSVFENVLEIRMAVPNKSDHKFVLRSANGAIVASNILSAGKQSLVWEFAKSGTALTSGNYWLEDLATGKQVHVVKIP